jgi:tetratricopeptide (TPR) repeat protein
VPTDPERIYRPRKVFIGSPSDVQDERREFPAILEYVNDLVAKRMGVLLEAISWKDCLPEHGRRPQDAINADLLASDLVVIVFWCRWGETTGAYSSGTEEEFMVARNAGKPIWIFFRSVPSNQMADPGDQLKKVLAFKSGLKQGNNTLWATYEEPKSWERMLTKWLCDWLNDHGGEPKGGQGSSGVAGTGAPSSGVKPQAEQQDLAQLMEKVQRLEAQYEALQGLHSEKAKGLAVEARQARRRGDVAKAEQLYAQAVAGGASPQLLYDYAVFLEEVGFSVKAMAQFDELARLAGTMGDSGLEVSARNHLGVLAKSQGNLGQALANFTQNLQTLARLVAEHPKDFDLQRQLASVHDFLGQILLVRGNLTGALKEFQESLHVAERLAKHDPTNTQWQRDLTVSHNKIGDVLVGKGELDSALKQFQESLHVAERLAKHDPTNTQWQRDLSVSHERIGDVLVGKGELDSALKQFQESLHVRERLAKHDSTNVLWQTDLVISRIKIVGFLAGSGENGRERALDLLKESLVALQSLESEGKLHGPQKTWIVDHEARIKALAEGVPGANNPVEPGRKPSASKRAPPTR